MEKRIKMQQHQRLAEGKDLKRDLDAKEIDELIEGTDYFPFVETWSTRTAEEMFENLVASDYGGPVEKMPKISIDFNRRDFTFSMPDRFLLPIPQLSSGSGEGWALLTHDIDNKDYREMNAVGEFYMEDLRLSSSRRRFMDSTPIEMWDSCKKRIVEIARERSGPNAGAYEIRNAVVSFTKESNPFRSSIALAVYSILDAHSILDMSSGWGDRLIGALAWARRSKRDATLRYQGYDPFSDLQPRYRAMISDFSGEDDTSRFDVTCLPFEDAPVEDMAFDVAFTSPPYFDFEKYGYSSSSSRGGEGEQQSTSRYPEVGAWVQGFLKPMMRRASLSLKIGGYLAINIEGRFMYKVLQYSSTDPDLFGPQPPPPSTSRGGGGAGFSNRPLHMKYMGLISYTSDNTRDRVAHPILVWKRIP